jgi:hypothetical protein
MELLLKVEEESEVVKAIDFDPAQYPCGLLAQLFYTVLALRKRAPLKKNAHG